MSYGGLGKLGRLGQGVGWLVVIGKGYNIRVNPDVSADSLERLAADREFVVTGSVRQTDGMLWFRVPGEWTKDSIVYKVGWVRSDGASKMTAPTGETAKASEMEKGTWEYWLNVAGGVIGQIVTGGGKQPIIGIQPGEFGLTVKVPEKVGLDIGIGKFFKANWHWFALGAAGVGVVIAGIVVASKSRATK